MLRHPAGRAVTVSLAVAVVASGVFAAVGVPFFTTRAAGGAEAPASWLVGDPAVSGVLTTGEGLRGTAGPVEYAYGVDYAGPTDGEQGALFSGPVLSGELLAKLAEDAAEKGGQAAQTDQSDAAQQEAVAPGAMLTILQGDTLTGSAVVWQPENGGQHTWGVRAQPAADAQAASYAVQVAEAALRGDDTPAAPDAAAIVDSGAVSGETTEQAAARRASLNGLLTVQERAGAAAGETELRWQIAGATVADVNAAPEVAALLRVGSTAETTDGSTADAAADAVADGSAAAVAHGSSEETESGSPATATAAASAASVAANVRVMVLAPGLAAVVEACSTGGDCDPGAATGSDGWSQAAALPAETTEVQWRVTVLNTGNVALTDVRVARAAAEGGLDTGTVAALEFGNLQPGASASATAVTRVADASQQGAATKLSVSLSAGFAGAAPDGTELADRFTDSAGTAGRVPSAEVSAAAVIGDTAGTTPSDSAGTESPASDGQGDAGADDAHADVTNADGSGVDSSDQESGGDTEAAGDGATPLVQGVVRLDKNANGAVDDGDDGIGGVVVSLYAEGGEDPLLQLWTGPDGSYQFPRETIAGVDGPYSLRLQTTSFEAAEQNYTPGNVFLRSSVPQLAITMTFTQGAEAVSMDGLVQSAPPPRTRTFASTAVNCPVVPVTFDGDGALFPYLRTYMPSGTNGYLGGSTTLTPAGGGSSLSNFWTTYTYQGVTPGQNVLGSGYLSGYGANQHGSMFFGGSDVST